MTYIDDGSKDGTLSEIKRMVSLHGSDKVRYISFSRNFGKESAIYAGLTNCAGDYVVLLDVDLQHPVTLIPEMLRAIEEEGKIKSFFSHSFYKVFNQVTSTHKVSGQDEQNKM